MSTPSVLRLPGSLAEVQASAEGPVVGAFFDLDGTLVAGMTGAVHTKERIRNKEIGPGELLRMMQAGRDYKRGRLDFERLIAEGVKALAGRSSEDLDELGERLFQTTIVDLVYPEMRDLVRAHQARGHTVVLSSSAFTNQVRSVADYLGIEDVLCNRFETDTDGVLTGSVVEPVIWGPGKAGSVQAFAKDNGVDLTRSYFYADGDEDVALMYLVGHPRPTNPGGQLAKVASRRGWPVLEFTSRGARGPMATLRSVAGTGSLLPLGAAGLAIGLVTRDKRRGLNLITGLWPRVLFQLHGVRLRVQGEEHLANRPAVFIFNHRNNYDPFIAGAVVKDNFTGVAKKELQDNPVMGVIGKLMDTAFIDRGDSVAAVESLKSIEELARKGLSILISPEGTRLDTSTVGEFKKGAFRIAMAAGLPIVPIVIRNAEHVAGRNSATLNPGTVDVVVLPPVATADWELGELSQRIDEVRQMFLDTLADWPEASHDA
jgi:putative phosphoserine phosphatase / 1-acylglycerol-3-phosphate O-acyltransferase